MTDPANVTVETLAAHWESHAQKIAETGVPLGQIAESLAKAAINVENDSFALITNKLSDTFAVAERALKCELDRPAPQCVADDGQTGFDPAIDAHLSGLTAVSGALKQVLAHFARPR